ncbi:MAG: 23S rRNA (guanosine(2251)-2'-O)-methyltransferase RlmB [Clostridia bacterium]|nr:23S rRNA (guanosine(2251)-2'-O)-methyltransferase RlmB [Clostridia bacterium]
MEENNENTSVIYGRNSVLEAFKSGTKIDKLFLRQGTDTGSVKAIVGKAKAEGVPIVRCQNSKLDEICGGGVNHQGVAAYTAIKEYVSVDDILQYAKDKGEEPFIVVLDELTDTMNVGSIVRTAECCGVHGVIMAKRRSAALNSTVAKTSSGAFSHMRIAQVTNLAQTLESLKDKGVWVIGADISGETIYSANLKGPSAFVIGAEGKGIGELVKKKCDFMVKVPMRGNVQSLNASVAAGVVLYEKYRQEYL